MYTEWPTLELLSGADMQKCLIPPPPPTQTKRTPTLYWGIFINYKVGSQQVAQQDKLNYFDPPPPRELEN